MSRPATLPEAAVESALEDLCHRVSVTLAATGDAFPYVVDSTTGDWRTTTDGNWAAGHWIGLLWLAAEHAADAAERARYAAAARAHTDAMRTQSVDNIFMGMAAHYAGFRGYDATGDRSLFGLGLTGADAMVALFDEAARQIPIGEYVVAAPGADADDGATDGGEADGPPLTEHAAVDVVYTSLPVLWRAYAETGDPRFRDVAVSHADRHLDWHLREDGSTQQITTFDPETGAVREQFSDLAYSDETCWARGLGWNLAGLARAYRETGAERYLAALERSTAYYVAHAPPDLVPHWDLADPAIPDAPRDTSAAALAAYGLVRLEGSADRVARLRETGERILASLVDGYLVTDPGDPRRGAVDHGTFNRPGDYGVDTELVWTNYYVAYALHSRLA